MKHTTPHRKPLFYLSVGVIVSLINGSILFMAVPELWAGERTVEICYDGVDNDENGSVDCDDKVCFQSPVCSQSEKCGDGRDNDRDGRIDCMDTDCFGNPLCPRSEVCGDGIDNDLDGFIDCTDRDCELSPVCPAREICDNGIDDDDNGQSDCSDEACALHRACTNAPAPQVKVIREVIEKLVEAPPVDVPTQEDIERMVRQEVESALENVDFTVAQGPSSPQQLILQQSGSSSTVIINNNTTKEIVHDILRIDTVHERVVEYASGPQMEKNCTDGEDNDANGKTDCDDDNCASHPSCNSVTYRALSAVEVDVGDS